MNSTRKSTIAEHLVNNPEYGKNYKDVRFTIVKQFLNVYDPFKMEEIFIYLNRPQLCKQK